MSWPRGSISRITSKGTFHLRGLFRPFSCSVMADTRNQLTDVLSCCRGGLIAVGAFSMAMNLLVLTVSVYMLQVYDRVLPGRSVDTLIYLTLIAAGALAAMGALESVRSRILVQTWHLDRPDAVARRSLGVAWRTRCVGLPYRTEALRDLATLRSLSRRGRNHGAVRCAVAANLPRLLSFFCIRSLDFSPLAERWCSFCSPWPIML